MQVNFVFSQKSSKSYYKCYDKLKRKRSLESERLTRILNTYRRQATRLTKEVEVHPPVQRGTAQRIENFRALRSNMELFMFYDGYSNFSKVAGKTCDLSYYSLTPYFDLLLVVTHFKFCEAFGIEFNLNLNEYGRAENILYALPELEKDLLFSSPLRAPELYAALLAEIEKEAKRPEPPCPY